MTGAISLLEANLVVDVRAGLISIRTRKASRHSMARRVPNAHFTIPFLERAPEIANLISGFARVDPAKLQIPIVAM
jgi:hypothetical protein